MKNKFNRLLSLILCFIMCFSLSIVASAAPVGLSVRLSSTTAEEGKLPSTVAMIVGTTSALDIMSFGAEAFASDSRITISAIQDGGVALSASNINTGRFAYLAGNESSISTWATVVFSIPADLPAGTYTLGVRSVTASRSDNSNPIEGITGSAASFTVTAATPKLTLTADDITIASAGSYTGSALTPEVTVNGLTKGDYAVEYYNNTNAGQGAYVIVSPVDGGSYTFDPVRKNFTIEKAEITITAKDHQIFIGQSAPALDEDDYSVSGLLGTDTLTTKPNIAYDSTPDTSVTGTYNIVVSGAKASDNYKINYVNGSLVISDKNDADASITGVPSSVTYGDDAFNLSASAANTGNNGVWTWTSSDTNVLSVSNSGQVTVVGAGKATITAKYESDTTIGLTSVEITVNKANQSIRGSHIYLQTGNSVNLSQIFKSDEGSLSYSISTGATISGVILTAGNVPGTYALEVTAAETTNYKSVTRGYDVIITEKTNDDPISPIVPPSVTRYTLSFETNGGSSLSPITMNANTIIKLNDFVTIKPGYAFQGWYLDKSLTNKVTYITLSQNMTVYAKWTEILDEGPCDGGKDCPSYAFTDVDQTQWYHEGIDFVVENGMMQGIGNNKFDPHGATSRAMIVTILYRLEGQPKVNSENPFDDVQNGTWYTDAVIWAAANGIVNGYGDGKFGPDDDITREQMARIMYNYAEFKGYDVSARASLGSFTDVDKISSWASEEMKWAVSVGLINGMGDGIVAPQGEAERCQVAAIFMRFCDKYVK